MTQHGDALEVAVIGAGVFSPLHPTLGAWAARTPAEPPVAPEGELIEKRSRRRVSDLTKALADAYAQAVAASGVDPKVVPTVFGSALGEASTMIGLLDQMWRLGEGLSPMKFAMSVHNAAAGVVSISAENREFTTSLGADFDTPAMALMEAIGIVATTGGPAAVVCGDDAVPTDIVPEELGWSLVAAAVVVAPVALAPGAPRIRGPFFGEPSFTPRAAAGSIERNPNVGLLDLIDALDAPGAVVRTDRGKGIGWCFEIRDPG